MSKKVIVLLAEGFEEVEAAAPIDVLRRAGAEVTAAGVGGTAVTGAHGLAYTADTTLAEAVSRQYDLVVFPGGMPGAKHLGESPEAKQLAEDTARASGIIAAICAAPVMTLGAWGMLNGRTATCYPGMEEMFPAEVTFSEERVVTDGKIVTSRGPGTALEFSLVLAGLLFGEDAAEKLAEAMLVRRS